MSYGPKNIESIRRFKLSDIFIANYKDKKVPWGPLGYVVYKRTYARILEDGTTEEWYQTCRRVIEGVFTIQKRHVFTLGLEWNDLKAQQTAKEAYDRLFHMKWCPAGRGLWMMGTPYVENKTGAGLFSCAFRSTKDLADKGGYIFRWIMDALMLGVGVGFDTLGAGTLAIKKPQETEGEYIIADSREGWCNSVEILLNGYYFGKEVPKFNYSRIRKAGEPIKGFGGISAGSDPLEKLHKNLQNLYNNRVGETIKAVDIVDTENLIGACIVSGNIRKSAAIALGDKDDSEFLEMKRDKEKLLSHRWSSNNTIVAEVGMDYSKHVDNTIHNGEPGYFWLENARHYGRFKDGIKYDDIRVCGVNPCSEQQLESGEVCNLTETNMAKHDNFEDYKETLEIAYMYAKTLTLVNTHWPETNAIMLKNRRIGLSQTGISQAFNKFGKREVFRWSDKGYQFLQDLDEKYSDWLCIPRSKRISSIKPGGTVPLLMGATPGIHYPEAEYYIRRIRFAKDSELLKVLIKHGYDHEPCAYSDNTTVVSFPVHENFYFDRDKSQVSMWEQLENVAQFQYYWADNSISVTISFQEHEAKDIKHALKLYETRLKSVSFLKYDNSEYVQKPLEAITKKIYESMSAKIKPLERITTGDEIGEKFCDSDKCDFIVDGVKE